MSKKTRITARINFNVRPPRTNGVGRGSFHIYKDVKPLVGKRDNKPHIFTSKDGKPDDRLDKINEGYRKCEMDFETAKKMAEALRDQLYKEHNLVKTKVFSTDNYEILDEFFQKRYASRKTKDKAAAFNDYRRAVDAVGLLPIRSASEAQLQEALSKFPNNKQRRYVSRLTRILKFKGRDDIELAKDRKQSAEIRYLSEKEFSAVLKNVEDKNLQIVFQMAFHSGCRLGEIFALDDEDYRNGILNVSKQFIREEIAKKRKLFKIVKGQKVLDLIQPTKNEQKRRVVVFSEFKNCF